MTWTARCCCSLGGDGPEGKMPNPGTGPDDVRCPLHGPFDAERADPGIMAMQVWDAAERNP